MLSVVKRPRHMQTQVTALGRNRARLGRPFKTWPNYIPLLTVMKLANYKIDQKTFYYTIMADMLTESIDILRVLFKIKIDNYFVKT
jgi:hypothetical protein